MRYLAIDLGDKRTGLALGDSITRLATPVRVLEVPIAAREGEQLLDALAAAIDDLLGPTGELVIGLPLNMDGTEGPRAKIVRAFAARLASRTARPLHFSDERLTSDAADKALARSGLTHKQKKERRDAIAAARILDGFLAAQQ
ncbi:MAG: Holliday junction resolvase RuvX [Phycisphaeraceae bacterium]|nr:Holliday junction resolvase RuvX [Phycisphaeraceae bacterium]